MSSTTNEPVDIDVREFESAPRVKKAPTRKGLGTPFVYNANSDGTDENLLILLHGLGDTEAPFGTLGKTFNLPQTATLALRAPERVPFLYEDAFQWYESFDPLGDLLPRPNPTRALAFLSRVLAHLITDCGWPAQRVHLFGFAQGGSLAGEFAMRQQTGAALGSVVSVCGPLLEFPTRQVKCTTPVLAFMRSAGGDALNAWKRGFERVVAEIRDSGAGESMPRGREEWTPIMAFWSDALATRPPEGAYGVSGSVHLH